MPNTHDVAVSVIGQELIRIQQRLDENTRDLLRHQDVVDQDKKRATHLKLQIQSLKASLKILEGDYS
jgi:hypothetical protein